MSYRTYMLFMAVSREDITLPILDWINNDNVSKLFEYDINNKSQTKLFDLSGRGGHHFYDILNVIERCNLKSLKFLDLDILEDGSGTALKDIELISAIRSLTIVIDELLKAVDPLWCLPNEYKNSKDAMREAFEKSEIYHNLDLDSYEREGLFIILKSLLLVMTDALVNNKVFVYIKWTA